MIFSELPYNEDNLRLLDTYQSSLPHAQFMQSSKWAHFQKERGNHLVLLADEHTEHIFLAIKHTLPLGFSYWYVPRFDVTADIEKVIKKIDSKAIFIRFDARTEALAKETRKTIDVQPSRTLVLKLEGPTEKILQHMHQKTRYNIRLAQKKKLTIKSGAEYAEDFFVILEETRKRDGFRLHSKAYYQAMIASGAVELRTIWNEGTMLAGVLLAYFGDTVTYVHGASSSKQRALMAPYALQWDAITSACDAGYQWYDWHGVDEKKWPGVTRFKMGFGGETIRYPGTFDLPLDRLQYAGYTIFRRLRRLF